MNAEEIREYCLSFPAVTEDIKWGENLVFSVREKMFCIVGLDHVPLTLSFKASDELFITLPQLSSNFISAPYLARAKWLLIQDVSMVSNELLKEHFKQAYMLIRSKLSRKIQQEIVDELEKKNK